MLGQVMQQVMAQLLGPNGPGGGLGGLGGGLAGPVGGPAGGAFPIPPPLPLMFDWDDLFFDMFEEDELLDEEEEEMDEEGDSDAEFELGVLPGGDGEEGGGAGGEWTAWGFGGLEWMDCEAWRHPNRTLLLVPVCGEAPMLWQCALRRKLPLLPCLQAMLVGWRDLPAALPALPLLQLRLPALLPLLLPCQQQRRPPRPHLPLQLLRPLPPRTPPSREARAGTTSGAMTRQAAAAVLPAAVLPAAVDTTCAPSGSAGTEIALWLRIGSLKSWYSSLRVQNEWSETSLNQPATLRFLHLLCLSPLSRILYTPISCTAPASNNDTCAFPMRLPLPLL